MTSTRSRYVYGPVPSRRLGRSLGIDLVPFKTCTYGCIYCQLGRTTCLTVERKPYVPADILLAECLEALDGGEKPDIISLAGSGEPTLNSGIGDVIRGIKAHTDIPVAVLTNGALLWQPQVREALMAADRVLPSLDAGSDILFQAVNRPHPSIAYDRMVDGLAAFTRSFGGQVWLEVLLVAGLTGTVTEVDRIAAEVRRIAPARVQLNTVCRPPAEIEAGPVPAARMQGLAARFDGHVDIVSPTAAENKGQSHSGDRMEARVAAIIARRPCTARDVAHGLGVHLNEALKTLEALTAAQRLTRIARDRQVYYIPSTRKT